LQAIASNSPRASVWEWAQTALLAGNLAWTTLCLGGYRAETAVVTVTLTNALLAVHFLARVFESAEAPLVHPAGWMLLPFLVYAAANVLWVTPVRWLGWLDWLGWAQMIAVFWVALNGIRARVPRQVLFFTLVALGIVGVGLAGYQRFVRPDWVMLGRLWPGDMGGRASGSFGIPNSFAGFLLLILPAVSALAFRRSAKPTARVWWGWVTAVLLFGVMLTISRGAWVALAVALVVWPLAVARGGWWRRVRMAMIATVAVAAVGSVIFWKSPRVRTRFTALVLDAGERTRPIMWRGAWRLFQERPALGTGAGSYNVLFERYRPERFPDAPLWAHNEYLNTLSDYGVVGFGLFFGTCLVIATRCVRGPREEKSPRRDGLDSPTVVAALGVGLLAFALQLVLDFHFKIPALALASATLAALVVGRTWPVAPAQQASRRRAAETAGWIAAFSGAIAAGFVFVPMLRAEAHRQAGRLVIDRLGATTPEKADYRGQLPFARSAVERATVLDPANAQVWSDLAYATALWSLVEPAQTAELGARSEAAAERALALSSVCSEFWIRRGNARDMQGRWPDAARDFAVAVKIAPTDAYAWYYYAEHLSRLKTTRESAEAALALCLRLDPGNPSGLALRQRLAIKAKAP
jgi:O-antigen ligase